MNLFVTGPERHRIGLAGGLIAVVTAIAVVVLGALASPAQAGSTAAGYSLMKTKLVSGKSVVVRWNPCQAAVTYRVNLAGLKQAKRAAMLKEIKAGFIKLAAADGIKYRYAGTTTFVPKHENIAASPAEIVVAVVPAKATDIQMSESTLGFGGVQWSTWSGGKGEGAAVVRGYVVLSPSGMAGLKAGYGKGKTQGNVILHELGHATGLNHTSVKGQLMNPVLTSSAPNGFARGDLAGLKKLGRSAGCITISEAVTIADLS